MSTAEIQRLTALLTLIGTAVFVRGVELFQSQDQIRVHIRAKLAPVAGTRHRQSGSNGEYANIRIENDPAG